MRGGVVKRGTSFVSTDIICYWCKQPAPDTPYRSPIPQVVGARYVVCGPRCPDTPAGAVVITDWGKS